MRLIDLEEDSKCKRIADNTLVEAEWRDGIIKEQKQALNESEEKFNRFKAGWDTAMAGRDLEGLQFQKEIFELKKELGREEKRGREEAFEEKAEDEVDWDED
jgi:hypothetical protein